MRFNGIFIGGKTKDQIHHARCPLHGQVPPPLLAIKVHPMGPQARTCSHHAQEEGQDAELHEMNPHPRRQWPSNPAMSLFLSGSHLVLHLAKGREYVGATKRDLCLGLGQT